MGEEGTAQYTLMMGKSSLPYVHLPREMIARTITVQHVIAW